MGLDIDQFVTRIIDPALDLLKLNSLAARELLLGTALQESRLTYLVQLGKGPALGLFQMEPATHDDIWENFLAYKPELSGRIAQIEPEYDAHAMIGNLWYAAAMCRVHYFRAKASLPEAGDLNAQAAYWKRYYNTVRGAGTVDEYIHNWRSATS